MKMDVNITGMIMDAMAYGWYAAVVAERGTAPSDNEIDKTIRTLAALYFKHEGMDAQVDVIPSMEHPEKLGEYFRIMMKEYHCPRCNQDEEEEDESDRIADFSSALDDLMEEYGLASETDYKYNEFIDNLYHYKD